jgi:hypothetical protein
MDVSQLAGILDLGVSLTHEREHFGKVRFLGISYNLCCFVWDFRFACYRVSQKIHDWLNHLLGLFDGVTGAVFCDLVAFVDLGAGV